MAEPIKVDIWSDVACPWCYLGKRRFDLALEVHRATPGGAPVTVEYHSYQLNPALPADHEGGHSDYLAQHLGMAPAQIAASSDRLRQMGQAVGIDYRMDRVVIANTLKAHELLHHAKAQGVQDAMKERLMKAYWTEGRPLGRIDVLAELAGEVGLDPDAARAALEAGTHSADVEADTALAARYGITGVPFFVLAGKYGVSGAQEVETFAQALATVAAEAA